MEAYDWKTWGLRGVKAIEFEIRTYDQGHGGFVGLKVCMPEVIKYLTRGCANA